MKRLSRLAIAAVVAPAFARGQPQLPDDNGGRASVLSELNPTRAVDDRQAPAADIAATQAQPCSTSARRPDAGR